MIFKSFFLINTTVDGHLRNTMVGQTKSIFVRGLGFGLSRLWCCLFLMLSPFYAKAYYEPGTIQYIRLINEVSNNLNYSLTSNWDANVRVWCPESKKETLINLDIPSYVELDVECWISDGISFSIKEIRRVNFHVVEVGSFKGCENLKTVSIGSEVQIINESAFSLCKELEIAVIPDGLSEIGAMAFYNCEKLKNVRIGNGVSEIKSKTFYNCINLQSAIIGNGVESIGPEAFSGCVNLTSLSMGPNVKDIQQWAFRNCSGLERLTIPDATSVVGYQAFSGCSNLKNLQLGSGFTTISQAAFSGCSMLQTLTLRDGTSPMRIEADAFEGCASLISLALPDKVQYIGKRAFAMCGNLVELTLGDGVKTIEQSAFQGCASLENLKIPSSVESIEASAFQGCNSLKTLRLDEGIKTIGKWAFSENSILSLDIPNSVVSIGEEAFNECASLQSLVLKGNLQSIGRRAFYNCNALQFLTNSAWSLATIGDEAFMNCYALESLDLPASVVSIGSNAFYECTSLNSLTIKGGSIGQSAFYNCSSLENLILGNHVSEISDGAFYGCGSLDTVSIGKNLERIGAVAFYGCSSLKALDFGEKVSEIGESAFYSCEKLQSLKLPNALIVINNNTFYNCKSLSDLTIGENVEIVGVDAFRNCLSLKSLEIPDKVNTIGMHAFQGCDSLLSLSLGRGVTKIWFDAFWNCKSLENIYCKSAQPADVFESAFHYEVQVYDAISGEMINSGRFNSHPILSVPEASEDLYRAHDVWKRFLIKPQMKMVAYFDSHESGQKTVKRRASGVRTMPVIPMDGKEVEGVTADGASKILAFFDQDVDDVIVNSDFTFKVNGVEVEKNDPKVGGELTFEEFAVPNSDESKWGFIFTAPEEYLCEGNEYILSIEVNAHCESGISLSGSANIRVMRPGVLLIHGFASDNTCFKELEDYLLVEGGYSKSQVHRVDYRESNTAGVDYNTYAANVVGRAYNILQNKLLEKEHIVSSKYDLVGHSMGGILSRMYAQKVARENVNRIITLDTPHYGSELSNFGMGVLNQMTSARVFYSLIIGMSIVPPFALLNSAKVLDAINKLQNEIENGRLRAIRDLGVNSDAILELNKQENVQKAKGVPVHAIYSCMTNIEEYAEIDFIYHGDKVRTPETLVGLKKVPLRDAPEIFIRNIFSEEVSTGCIYDFYKEKFGGDNDGVVSVVSQLGGFTHDSECVSKIEDVYRGLGGWKSNAHHCQTNHYIGTMQEIKNLLHLPSKDARFDTNGFKPLSSPMRVKGNMVHAQGIEFKVAEDTSFIKLNLLRDDSARVAIIHVDQSEDVVSNLVYALVGNDEILISNDRTDFCFEIPETFNGELKIQALGRTDYNALVADTAMVEYTNSARLDFMYYEDKTPVIAHVGDTIRLNVFGEWSNGEEGYLRPVFSTDADSLLLIDGRIVIANAVGECTLTASYLGLSDDIHVTILPNIINFADAEVKRICVENWDTDGDGELTREEAAAVSDIGLSFIGNHNIMTFEELQYFTGLTAIPERAFEEVTNLVNIKLPQSVLTIGTYAFYGCSSLTKIELAEGLERIGYSAFDGCSALERISLPNSLESIQTSAFNYCRELKGITIPANVVEIGSPIGGWYFGMERMRVEEGNPIFDSRENCNAIIETATNKLIAGCEATVIPSSVKTIGEWAFNCCLISDFAIPEGVEVLEDNAFMGCQFNRIELPSSLVHIGMSFSGCSYIKNIVSHIRVPMPIADETFPQEALTAILYVPAGTKTLYEATDGWKNFRTIVEMEAVKGDVNGDDKVTIADVTALVNIILGKNQMQPYLNEVADVNGDGKVTIADVTALVNVILGK